MEQQPARHHGFTGARLVAAIALMLTLAAPTMAAAEGPTRVTVDGLVQWVSGQAMTLATSGRSVLVDLTGLPLSSYNALGQGTLVRVSGMWTVDNRLLAQAIERLPRPVSPGPSERTP